MITIAYGSNSVQLAGPEFGDTWSEDQAFRNNTLRSQQVVNNQADRPLFQTLDYNIRAVTQTELDALNVIISAAKGYKVTLTPPDGTNVDCYISNVDIEEIIQRDGCAYDVRLQFAVSA